MQIVAKLNILVWRGVAISIGPCPVIDRYIDILLVSLVALILLDGRHFPRRITEIGYTSLRVVSIESY